MKHGIFLVFLLGFFKAFSQDTNLIHFSNPISTIQIQNLDLVSLDTKDQIFASSLSGDILLFDSKGKQINFFSPPRQGRLNQLEASWTVNIFSFSTDLQEFRILDRFLNPLIDKGFLDADINLPKAATLGNNNVIWVWDESDLSLKSLNYLQNQLIQSQPLNLILDTQDLTVSEIREFKNRVFLNAPSSGIFIFDNQANFLQKVDLKIDQRLCFYRENLFWVEGNILKRYSLFEKEVFDVGILPTTNFQFLQIGQEILTLIQNDRIEIFSIPEEFKSVK